MMYKRQFTINGKAPNKYAEGTLEKVVFKDTETGEEFKSFIDMAKHFGHNLDDNCATISGCYGTESYHGEVVPEIVDFDEGKKLIVNTWTDGVQEFIEKHNAYWFVDVIGSYLRYISNVVVTVDPITRKQEWICNKEGLDSFVTAFLVKLSETSAMFLIEMDGEWNAKREDFESISIVAQFIPFTDIDVDNIEMFIEAGVTLFPSEH